MGAIACERSLELLGGKDIYLDISSTMAFIDLALLQVLQLPRVEHILFGSDYPLFSPGEELTKLERLLLTYPPTTASVCGRKRPGTP